MNILMTPHGGCYNHGCEAIVQSTAAMLGNQHKLFLYSTDIENDKQFGLDQICTLIENDATQQRVGWLRKKVFAAKERAFGKNRDLQETSFRNRRMLFDPPNTFVLSIGGDNYCYVGMQHVLREQMQVISYNNMKCMLWGCSFEEELLTPEVIEDLKRYRLISVRESISYELLHRHGISDSVIQCADPAFILEPESVDKYDDILNSENTIGINISALMKRYDSYDGATMNNFCELIRYILSETNFNILMIPHVRQTNNDDLKTIKHVLKEFVTDRIKVVEEKYNCRQLKYLISKCRFFIGCRTHSTIAAYSTCVPTLVVGYSTKSLGICRDLFGKTEGLVVDGRTFNSDTDLLGLFVNMIRQENELRTHLNNIMPDYILRAYEPIRYLNSLLG